MPVVRHPVRLRWCLSFATHCRLFILLHSRGLNHSAITTYRLTSVNLFKQFQTGFYEGFLAENFSHNCGGGVTWLNITLHETKRAVGAQATSYVPGHSELREDELERAWWMGLQYNAVNIENIYFQLISSSKQKQEQKHLMKKMPFFSVALLHFRPFMGIRFSNELEIISEGRSGRSPTLLI